LTGSAFFEAPVSAVIQRNDMHRQRITRVIFHTADKVNKR